MRTRKGPMTLAEHKALLEADPEWIARRNARDRELAKRQAESRLEQAPILLDLRNAGIFVDDIWDLVNSPNNYAQAYPVLLKHFVEPYSDRLREAIGRALGAKEARLQAWDFLVELVRGGTLPDGALTGAMVALSAMATPTDLPALIDMISDPSLGSSRIFLVANLMRTRRPEARQTLVNLRNDPDLSREIAARLKIR